MGLRTGKEEADWRVAVAKRQGETMAGELVPDDLWAVVEPLLPPPQKRRFRNPGRRPIEARKALGGILFVLRSGIPWQMLPLQLGCGSGSTCWRRLQAWQKAGVWERLHQVLLNQLQGANRIDWSRAVMDSSSVRAMGGGKKRAQTLRIDGNWVPSTTLLRKVRAYCQRR